MTAHDFKSVSPMDNYMQSNIIGLSKMQWLHFEKEQPYKLFYKENYNQDFPFHIKDLIKKTEKTTSGRPKLPPATVVLPNLHAKPPQIKLAKYQNLMQLLPFVPPIHHKFYKDLSYEGKTSRLQQKKQIKSMKKIQTLTEFLSPIQNPINMFSLCSVHDSFHCNKRSYSVKFRFILEGKGFK